MKHDSRLNNTYKKEKIKWRRLTRREVELAGIFLYWGEGAKLINGAVFLNNTDPEVLKFTLYWMTYALNVPKEK